MKVLDVDASNANLERGFSVQTNEGQASSSTTYVRTNEQAHSMVKNVPQPPPGFDFSIAQRQQQQQFFKSLVDRFVSRDDVDLYDADIVAVCTLLLFSRGSAHCVAFSFST
jgi:hypothetical protein